MMALTRLVTYGTTTRDVPIELRSPLPAGSKVVQLARGVWVVWSVALLRSLGAEDSDAFNSYFEVPEDAIRPA